MSDVEKNRVENDIFWKVSAFKTDHRILQLLKLAKYHSNGQTLRQNRAGRAEQIYLPPVIYFSSIFRYVGYCTYYFLFESYTL